MTQLAPPILSSTADSRFKDLTQAKDFIEELKGMLEYGGDNGATDAISAMTDEVNKLRERLGSLERGANVFDMMAESIGNGTDERDSLIRNFEGAAHLLLQMEEGATRYGDAIDRFYKLIEAGDKDGLKKLMEELGDIFKGDVSITREGLAEKIEPVLNQLRAKLVAIEKERRAAVATPSDGTAQGERDRVSTIERLNGDAKAAQAAIEQLTQKVEEFNKAAFNPKQVANINKYLDDLLAQAAAWGSAYKDFAPDAGNDPVERIFDRARREGQLARGLLQDVSDVTNADSAAARGPAIAKKTEALAEMDRLRAQEEELEKQIAEAKADRDYWKNKKGDDKTENSELLAEVGQIKLDSLTKKRDPRVGAKLTEQRQVVADQNRIIDQQDEADQMAKARLDALDEELEKLNRKLDIEEQIANLQRVQTDAQKRAADSSQAWRFGETESDKDGNQAAAAITRAALETMERRNFEIDAARKQVAIDTVKAMKEQTDEASKRFQLASREDQLRAAALSRTVRDKGKIGMNEFAMLSQPTRQAVVNYLPNEAPGNLNEAKAAAAKAYRDLNEEQVRLTGSIGSVGSALEELALRITRGSKPGGPLDVIPHSPPGGLPSIQDAATRDMNPVITLDIGNINM